MAEAGHGKPERIGRVRIAAAIVGGQQQARVKVQRRIVQHAKRGAVGQRTRALKQSVAGGGFNTRKGPISVLKRKVLFKYKP
jgi:hypothetical protein